MGSGFCPKENLVPELPPELKNGKRQAWTFSSSGWLFCYFFGVIKCLRDLEMDK